MTQRHGDSLNRATQSQKKRKPSVPFITDYWLDISLVMSELAEIPLEGFDLPNAYPFPRANEDRLYSIDVNLMCRATVRTAFVNVNRGAGINAFHVWLKNGLAVSGDPNEHQMTIAKHVLPFYPHAEDRITLHLGSVIGGSTSWVYGRNIEDHTSITITEIPMRFTHDFPVRSDTPLRRS